MAAIGLRLLAVVSLAVMMAAIKLASERGVSVVESLFFRQALALPLILAWIGMGPGFASLKTARFGAHAVRSAVGMTGMFFNFWAVTLLPLAEATTIGFTVPIFGTILSAIALRESPGGLRWLAVLVGFCGVVVMVRPDADHFPLAGVAVALTGAVLVATISILLRELGRTEATATTVFWFTMLSLPPLGLLMLRHGQAHDPATWGILLVVGLAGGVGQLCLTGALRWAPVSVVLPMDYTSLLWATLFGWIFWSSWPEGPTWIGASLIVASGLAIVWRERVRGRLARPPAKDAATGADDALSG